MVHEININRSFDPIQWLIIGRYLLIGTLSCAPLLKMMNPIPIISFFL